MDHYTSPVVYTSSAKVPTFFDVVIKRPVTDVATSFEAFCLSGVDGKFICSCAKHTNPTDISLGVVGKLVKERLKLRGEVVELISDKLRTFLPLLSTW